MKEQEKEIQRLKKENDFLEETSSFFAASHLKFLAIKKKDGESKGDIAFFCQTLHVSRQGFY